MPDIAELRHIAALRLRPWQATRVDPLALAPAVVAAVLFKLAISDGGRDPLSLTIAQVVTYFLVIVLIWTGRARLSPVGKAMIGLLAVMALTSFTSVRPEASIRQILLWTMYLGILVIVESTLTSPQAARRLTDALVAIAGWLVLIALFMHWGAGNPRMRWYSTFYWPNPFAGFLLLVLPLAVVRYLCARIPREALAHGAMSALLAMAFVLTYSRGAWLSLAAVLPLMAWLLRPLSWWKVLMRAALLAAAVAVAVIALTAGPSARSSASAIADRAVSVADPGDYSIQGRLHFWSAALAIFRDHPLLGTGPGTFGAVHAAYQRDVRYYAKDAHNLYLQTMAEMGVPGVLALVAVVAALAGGWTRSLGATRNSDLYPLAAGLGVGVLAFLLHSGVEMNWMFPAAPALAWASVGVLELSVGYPILGTTSGTDAPRSRWWRPAVVGILTLALAATLCSEIARRQYLQGQILARQGRWDLAAQAYLTASRWNPLDARFSSSAAGALMQARPEESDRAEALLRRAMRADRMNASHPIELARIMMVRPHAELRFRVAENLLRNALTLDPVNRPDAYRLLARLYLAENRRVDAARVYEQAASRYLEKELSTGLFYMLLWPQAAALVQDWAAFVAADGRVEAAAELLRQLVRVDPAWAPAYLQLADLYRRLGRAGEEESVVREGLLRAPGSEDLWARWRTLRLGRAAVHER